jgi:t-SNARE complex subunit (syntaxin)
MENITYGTEVATEVASKSHAELALEARYRSLTAQENDLSEREAYLSKVKAQIIELAKSLVGDDVIIVQREDFDNLLNTVETAISNAEDSGSAVDDLQSEVYDLKRCVDTVDTSADDAKNSLESSLADLESALEALKGLV